MRSKAVCTFTIVSVLLLLITQLFTGAVSSQADAGKHYQPLTPGQGMQMVAENGYLRLYADGQTSEIMVECLSDGTKWYSNPLDRNEKSQGRFWITRLPCALEYLTPKGELLSMDSLGYSVKSGNFSAYMIDSGVRFVSISQNRLLQEKCFRK